MKESAILLLVTILIGAIPIQSQNKGVKKYNSSQLVTALRNNVLVESKPIKEKNDEIHLLGAVRLPKNGDKSYIEISDKSCTKWSKVMAVNVLSARSTRENHINCNGEVYPYLNLTLFEDVDIPQVRKMAYIRSFIKYPKISFGGGSMLGISDILIDACTDTYLDCQLTECDGSGQWCQDMCDYEFDWCIRDR